MEIGWSIGTRSRSLAWTPTHERDLKFKDRKGKFHKKVYKLKGWNDPWRNRGLLRVLRDRTRPRELTTTTLTRVTD